ncbi:MAG: F0F1 ATP synthase subunit delta [Pseudonocardia sp.]
MALMLQAASRDSLAEAGASLDRYVDSASGADLERLGDELFTVMQLLVAEPGLRRALADPAVAASARAGLADRLLDDHLSRPTLDVVAEVVSARWSRSPDLLEAIEVLARRATLGAAEKDGSLDEVEDQLFRFGRVLDREPELNSLLTDGSTPAAKRSELLRSVLGGKVSPVTEALLTRTVQTPRGRSLDLAAEELSELAAARRDRYVAHVLAPVGLSPDQEQRLVGSLSRLYSRPITLQIELDESLLGGLVVRVGDEVIDGSVSGKLAAARRHLPG